MTLSLERLLKLAHGLCCLYTLQVCDFTVTMDAKEYYKNVMSKRDFQYYDTFSSGDQQQLIKETQRRLQESNLKRMKECVVGDKTMTLLGIASHVGQRNADVKRFVMYVSKRC